MFPGPAAAALTACDCGGRSRAQKVLAWPVRRVVNGEAVSSPCRPRRLWKQPHRDRAHSSGTCLQKAHFLDSGDHARQTWGRGRGKIRSWAVGLTTDPAAELAELAPKQ